MNQASWLLALRWWLRYAGLCLVGSVAHRSASPTTNVRRSSLVFLLRSVGSSLESQHSVARASGIHCSLLLGTMCWTTFHHQSSPAPSSPATALLYASDCAFSCAAWSPTCRCSVHGPTVPDRRRQMMPFCRLSWTEGNRGPPCNVLCWLHLPATAEMSAIGVSPVARSYHEQRLLCQM